MKLLIYILGIIGSTGSLLYSFDFNANINIIFSLCILMAIFIYLGYINVKNKSKFVIFGLIIDGLLLFLPNMIACFSYLISIVVHKYREVSVYDLSYVSEVNFFDEPFICLGAFLLIFIPMYILACVAIDKNKYFLGIIALLPAVFVELLFTITPPPFFIACYVLYFLVLLIGGLQKGVKIKIPIIMLCIFSMVFTYVVFGIDTYRISPINLFNKAKTPIASAGNIRDEYDIKKQGDRYYRNSLDFVISGADQLGDFKIRGIAYDQYDNGNWKIMNDDKTYIEWIYRNLQTLVKVTKANIQTINIKQLSGFSYRNYAPYYFSNEDLVYYGNYFTGENPQVYEMVVPNEDFNKLLTSVSADNKKAMIQEIANKNGIKDDLEVLQTYHFENEDILTAVSKEDARVIDQFLLDNAISYNGDVYDLINQCKDALAKQTSYTLRPGNLPSDENYLNYFLNVNKRGYCIHYASSLALMLRRNGVASRFVSGYQVNDSRDNDGNLLIRDRNEHAWVEIFDDYLGWIPIEAIDSGVRNEDNSSQSIPSRSNQNNNQTTPITPNTNQGKTPDIQDSDSSLSGYIYILGGLLIVFVSIIIQAYIRRKMMFKKAKSNKELVCYYYHYLSKLNGDVSKIKDLADKARFSTHEISNIELKFVEEYYFKQIKHLYNKANIIKKIYYKFILAYI